MKVWDMHCDTLSECNQARKAGKVKSLLKNDLQVDLIKLKKGDYMLQCFAVFVNLHKSSNPLITALEEIDFFYEMLEQYKDEIALVHTFFDIKKNESQGKLSAMLTMEEGEICMGNLSVLRMLYQLGVRMMTLTWNYENQLAFPNVSPHWKEQEVPVCPNRENGLKETGFVVLEEMERLHMIVDVSHLSDAGFWDVAHHAKRPFVASHSNARAKSPHVRNLTDEMIRFLGEHGGLLGINYYPPFLDCQPTLTACKSTAGLMADHIQYIKNLAGMDVLGLGSDFDGIMGDLELKDASFLPVLEAALKKRGFHESEIEKLFYKNALRVFQELL